MNDLEVQAETKDAQIEAMRTTIDKLGEEIYILEDENDKIKEEAERMRDDDAAERERLEALSAALKEVSFILLLRIQSHSHLLVGIETFTSSRRT